jgi:glycerophosphoryl diester phosphodiesterase
MANIRAERPIVIAHRGASGYLPEHTIAAKVLAHAQRADFLEQDVVLTRDDVPVVFHDLVLEEVTDVASVYPARRRADGHWYVIDFTWQELGPLTVRERMDPASGRLVWPRRFGEAGLPFRIVALEEELKLIRGLNAATGRRAGIYTEVKSPVWHRAAGKDLSAIVLDMLKRFGYARRRDLAFVQCFDDVELQRIRHELRCDLKLVQLIGENAWQEAATDYDALRKPAALAALAAVADGIGPWLPQVVSWPQAGAEPVYSQLVAQAHAAGLVVHPYVFRLDQLPEHAPSAAAVHTALVAVGVDGLFSDFPDRSLALLGGDDGGGA